MGLFSGVGKFVNDVFGATKSSDQAFGQSKYLQNLSYQNQKDFAQNAHQWEMEDLQKAGLNPALTTGASSAGAIAGGGSTGGQGTTGTPVDILSSLANVMNNTRMTNAQVDSLKKNANANMINANANMTNAKTNRTKMKGSKEGVIGNIAEKGMSGTFQGIKDWFSK